MSVPERIRKARLAKGLNPRELAELIGVTRTAVNDWEAGRHFPTPKQVPALAKALDLPSEAFNRYGGGGVSITPGMPTISVPLLKWEELHAISAAGVVSMTIMKKARFIPAYADPNLSKDRIALRVEDDSMEPTFKPGELIFIDPAMREPVDNVIVVARIGSKKEHVLRCVRRKRGGAFDLVAENPGFSTWTANADNHAEIIGTVVEHHRRLK